MSGIDTIAGSSLFASARLDGVQIEQANHLDHPLSANQNQPTQQRLRADVVIAPAAQNYARLNYDIEVGKVIVEVINPQTGDVLLRLPFEALSDELVRNIANGRGSKVDINA